MKKLTTVRVLLNGANGKMGQAIARLINENPQKNLVVSAKREAGQTEVKEPFDIVVDFSTPQGAQEAFLLAKKYKKPFLTGTTNLPEPFLFKLQSEEKIPVFFAPNVSLSVYFFTELVKQACKMYKGYEKALHEIHHVHKKDAPSGTAKNLAVVVHYPVEKVTYERIGETVGTHTLTFKTPFDEITLSHQALNRDLFAFSALQIATWLLTCPSGFYTMEDYAIFKLKEK
jgi:4-hydroxy-tetrahydrodipicolinate reductase